MTATTRARALSENGALRAEVARLRAALTVALEGVRQLDGGTYADSWVADEIEDAIGGDIRPAPSIGGLTTSLTLIRSSAEHIRSQRYYTDLPVEVMAELMAYIRIAKDAVEPS